MAAAPPLELWGGVECTVVRVGDDFRSQLHDTGHWSRMSDLDAMAELGIKAVRYPIVWETVAPEVPTELDFSWHDKRLNRLRERRKQLTSLDGTDATLVPATIDRFWS